MYIFARKKFPKWPVCVQHIFILLYHIFLQTEKCQSSLVFFRFHLTFFRSRSDMREVGIRSSVRKLAIRLQPQPLIYSSKIQRTISASVGTTLNSCCKRDRIADPQFRDRESETLSVGTLLWQNLSLCIRVHIFKDSPCRSQADFLTGTVFQPVVDIAGIQVQLLVNPVIGYPFICLHCKNTLPH